LMMSREMQQAVHLMQMPVMELLGVVEAELEHNPVLEYDEVDSQEESQESESNEISSEKELDFNDRDLEVLRRLDEDFRDHFSESENYYTKRSVDEEKLKSYQEQSIQSQESLFEHLMRQAADTFDQPNDYAMSEILIGSLDAAGFLKTPLSEIALLNHFNVMDLERILLSIQTFDPFGVGGCNLRESLLIQMRCRKEEKTLAYEIIDKNFEDLLHNRIPNITHALSATLDEVIEAIRHKIARLDLHPGASYSRELTHAIVPDVSVFQEDDKLKILVNEERIPIIRLNSKYLRMLDDQTLSSETKEFIRNKLMSAKWLLKNIDQRNETLYRVVEALTKHQSAFFLKPDGKISPLTLNVIAAELDLHESTIARVVANKYIDTPRGVVKLKYLFSNTFKTAEGDDISSKTVRDVLKSFIEDENKKKPLSDEALSKLLEKKGIPCARRTVAKYRNEMKIGNTKQRKEY